MAPNIILLLPVHALQSEDQVGARCLEAEILDNVIAEYYR